MSTIDKKLLEERQFADQQVSNLDLATANRWQTCRSAHRFMAFQGKKLVAYKLLFGKPHILNIYTCESLHVDFKEGLSSVWAIDHGWQKIRLSHTPQEVARSCFLWHTKRSGLDFVEYDMGFSMKFSMAYKTELNPSILEDGKVYLLEKAVFDNYNWQSS